jgi:hypothetical protein
MRILQIQGLRALAALLVTIFHAKMMPGGFIGVDIFSVLISTPSISEELNAYCRPLSSFCL